MECTPIGPWPPLIIGLGYDHPYPTGSWQFAILKKHLVARQYGLQTLKYKLRTCFKSKAVLHWRRQK